MQNTAEYICAYCGEPNLTFVDFSAGGQQSYVEDCQVCCRPNILYVRIDEDTLDIEIDTEYEGWAGVENLRSVLDKNPLVLRLSRGFQVHD